MITSRPGAVAHEADGVMRSLGGKMKVLSRVQVLAERNGWSITRAQGFLDGEMSRRRGVPPSTFAQVGIDDYALGFRAGYYERAEPRERDKKVTSTSAAVIVQAAAREKMFEDGLLNSIDGRGLEKEKRIKAEAR